MGQKSSIIGSSKSNVTSPYPSNKINQSTLNSTEMSSQLDATNLNQVIHRKNFLHVELIDAVNQKQVSKCSDMDNIISYYRRERFDFAQPIRPSITDDTPYYGSSFISDWLIMFTKGALKIKSSLLFEALIDGILSEGKALGFVSESQALIDELCSIKTKKIDQLQQCCARLYTKPCFLFKVVNETLRDDDRSKLKTLGPFCYLLYNYIDKKPNEYLSLKYQLKLIAKSTEQMKSMIVYRGEQLPLDQIEVYRKAVGKDHRYKWSSFISTSKQREVAEMFGSNILYIIQIQKESCNDQYVDVSSIAYIQDEQ